MSQSIGMSRMGARRRAGMDALAQVSAREYPRRHLERLGVADQVPEFRWGSKRVRIGYLLIGIFNIQLLWDGSYSVSH
jgi:hypothetical protein